MASISSETTKEKDSTSLGNSDEHVDTLNVGPRNLHKKKRHRGPRSHAAKAAQAAKKYTLREDARHAERAAQAASKTTGDDTSKELAVEENSEQEGSDYWIERAVAAEKRALVAEGRLRKVQQELVAARARIEELERSKSTPEGQTTLAFRPATGSRAQRQRSRYGEGQPVN